MVRLREADRCGAGERRRHAAHGHAGEKTAHVVVLGGRLVLAGVAAGVGLAVGVIHPGHVRHGHRHHRLAMTQASRLGRRGGSRAGQEADHG